MENETPNAPNFAAILSALNVRDAAFKAAIEYVQDKVETLATVVASQQNIIAQLCEKQKVLDDSYLALTEAVRKSIVKIDQSPSGLGLN